MSTEKSNRKPDQEKSNIATVLASCIVTVLFCPSVCSKIEHQKEQFWYRFIMTDCYVSLDILLNEPGRQPDHITFALLIIMNAFTILNYATDKKNRTKRPHKIIQVRGYGALIMGYLSTSLCLSLCPFLVLVDNRSSQTRSKILV